MDLPGRRRCRTRARGARMGRHASGRRRGCRVRSSRARRSFHECRPCRGNGARQPDRPGGPGPLPGGAGRRPDGGWCCRRIVRGPRMCGTGTCLSTRHSPAAALGKAVARWHGGRSRRNGLPRPTLSRRQRRLCCSRCWPPPRLQSRASVAAARAGRGVLLERHRRHAAQPAVQVGPRRWRQFAPSRRHAQARRSLSASCAACPRVATRGLSASVRRQRQRLPGCDDWTLTARVGERRRVRR